MFSQELSVGKFHESENQLHSWFRLQVENMEGKIIVRNPNGSSKVWDHFGFYKIGTNLLKDKAVCKICHQECKYTGGTTNLNQHLHKHHGDLFHSTPSSSKKSIQSQITTMMKQPIVKMATTSKGYQQNTESIAEFITGQMLPLSVVDSVHFRGMVNTLSNGTFDPPHRKYFTKNLLPKMLTETTEQMKIDFQSIIGIGLTTDAWTSCATENYMAYTAHYITKEWELKCKVLSTHCSEEKHTSENLAADMKNIERKWCLDKLLFSPVYVHDNASNITKAPKIMEPPRIGIGCLAHTINLAASSATKIPGMTAILAKARKVVTTFKRSSSANNVLKRKQQLLLPDKQHKLILDCPTRWNSSYDMLERLHEQSQAVIAAVLDPELKHLQLRDYLFTAEEQAVSEEIVSVLQPLKIATLLVSSEKNPTASRVLPTLAKLKFTLRIKEDDSKLAIDVKTRILESLNSRYTDQSVSSFLLKASYLDPRYKHLHNIATEGASFVTRQAVRDMCLVVADNQSSGTAVKREPTGQTAANEEPSLPNVPSSTATVKTEPPAENSEPQPKRIKLEESAYDDWLSDVIFVGTSKNSNEISTSELVNKELEKYDAEPQITGDPLLWWKSREGSLPILSKVAKAILCVPGSSVPSERVFSKAGELVNKRRSSLKTNHVDMLIFLNKNYPYKHTK